MKHPSQGNKLGILVGGGPAPGINAVIHSATIEAISHGLEVVGIYDGFEHLMDGEVVGVPLRISDVSRIHRDGGSILRTARANPTKSPEALRACARALIDAGITAVVGIGGDDTAFSLYRVAAYAQEQMGAELQSVHVPKTIDNDLPLPEGIPTFGFETAREVGARLVMTFMEDALTSQNWFFVVTMGRKAGHLALGIGRSSGATLTVIPEEWRGRKIRFQEVVDILVSAILLRLADGKRHGVALVAEGILEYLLPEDLKELGGVVYDDHGHVRMEEINLSDAIKHAVGQDLARLGLKVGLRDKELGYELRCAPPIAYDIDYARRLGEAAVDFLLNSGTNATITLQQNEAVPIPSERMMDAATGRTEVRLVNVDSSAYRSARKFMIRLKPQHAQDEVLLDNLALLAHLTPAAFRARYGYLMGLAPHPF
jgi:6-phosphofructokinase 1